jgi:hypothetical protein
VGILERVRVIRRKKESSWSLKALTLASPLKEKLLYIFTAKYVASFMSADSTNIS